MGDITDELEDALDEIIKSIRALKAAILAMENYDPKTYKEEYDYNRDLASSLQDVDEALSNAEDIIIRRRG